MTLDVHEKERTPHAFHEVVLILAQAYEGLTGELPDARMLAVAAGIIGLENGQGILIFGENFGNVSARDGSVFPNTFHKDGEPSPEFFAWFPSADVGARAWWRLMLRRYRPVLAAAFDGDPQLAVRELYRLGYVVALRTGEEGDYARGVASLARKAWPVASQIGLTHVDRPAWQGAAALAASVAAAVSAAFLARVAA